ncbi:MAG: hypothetical protein ACKVT0_06665 [Planctomycetaceae bacterium]
MTTTLDLNAITGNLFDYWDLHFLSDVATVYPGVDGDTQNLSEWVDVELPEFGQRLGRASSPARGEFLWRVNIFVRRSNDLARMNVIAEAVFSTISRMTIPLYALDSSETLLGYAQLLEAEIHNQTRPDRESRAHDMQRATIVIKGLVQET